ncbi:MAG: hypothetical protein WA160_03015 [Pseudobdellovibrio sp.]
MATLNSEAEFNSNRKSEFKADRDSKKVFDSEREKGLALFLEEQEKWDLIREKGLVEQRKQKKIQSPVEGGPEDIADQQTKKLQKDAYEKARLITASTRQRIQLKKSKLGEVSESEELKITLNRPRFDLRKRGLNKWVKSKAQVKSGTPGSSSSGFDDFPSQPDYMPAPQPVDNFEDIPPPPPFNYENSGSNANPYGGGIDSGFGDVPPPPPPPPMDLDF